MPGDGETAVTVDPPKQEDAPSASAPPKEKKEREPRLWEEWPGKDRFFCDGRCMTGPSPGALLGTTLTISIPVILFLAFVVPDVASEHGAAIWVFAVLLPAWSVTNLVITGTSDPGYLPRLPHPGPTPDGRVRPRYREEIVEGTGKAVTVKWNDTCNFYQPPRAHHCSVNDDCVDKFDHHCPWVGTTIGRRNYRTFLFFVFGTLLMCVYVVCVCALQIQIKRDDLAAGTENRTTKAIEKAPVAMLVMIFAFVFFWFLGIMTCFHAYLVLTNQTTYESFRDGYGKDENPYWRGRLGNCAEAFCWRRPPSRFNFRGTKDQQPKLDDAWVAHLQGSVVPLPPRVDRKKKKTAKGRAEEHAEGGGDDGSDGSDEGEEGRGERRGAGSHLAELAAIKLEEKTAAGGADGEDADDESGYDAEAENKV